LGCSGVALTRKGVCPWCVGVRVLMHYMWDSIYPYSQTGKHH
jgi:hypothetical protein